MGRTFVGFGLGAVQTGLFLYEARRSGAFDRLVVSEVDGALVGAVRDAGSVAVNIARREAVERVRIDGLEVLDPGRSRDRARLVRAVREAEELATAVPSVALYRGGAASPAAVLAEGLDGSRARILYAAENHNRAAEILSEALGAAPPRFQALNTVIGKMGGVITDAAEIEEAALEPMAPGIARAVLVEEFAHILVSRVTLEGLSRGLAVFEEKDDLLPFEEAKLFGHNAIHCLLGFLGAGRGYALLSEVGGDRELMELARGAFREECGAALVAKHRGRDPLFTPQGMASYADDLLARMTNPWLRDGVSRVCRDPRRKLGYGDRLIGAMRLALSHGIEPVRLARAARAGVDYLARESAPPAAKPSRVNESEVRAILQSIWSREPAAEEDGLAGECLRLVAAARLPPPRGQVRPSALKPAGAAGPPVS